MSFEVTNLASLSFAILPIDLKSGDYAGRISGIHLSGNNMRAIKNSSGYFVFTNLDRSSSYRIIVQSNSYANYNNEIDLPLLDYDERVNPNFEDMLNGEPGHDQRLRKPDPTIFLYLNDLVSLNTSINDGGENFFIKNITVFPSKASRLKVIITKLKNNSYNPYHDGDLEHNEIPFEEAEVSLSKDVSLTGPINSIVINPDQINKNIYEFLDLDSHSFSGDILDSKTILRKRNYIRFEDTIPSSNIQDVQIDISILKDSLNIVIPKMVLESQMTTTVNVLIIG
jgi:hypothetical protein